MNASIRTARALVAVLVTGMLLSACASATSPASPSTELPRASATVPAATSTPRPAEPSAPATAVAISGAGIDGHWEGAIAVAGQQIVTRADFKTEGGALKGTVDFPQQQAFSLPVAELSVQNGRVHFEVLPKPRTAVFDGALQDNNIAGSFAQAGVTGTFQLARAQSAAGAPLPYKEEEVTFQNGSIVLAGTLTLPAAKGPHPGVVLISGSGAQNRDEEIFGFKIFQVIADHLTRKGIAVLRYDDRGIGGSTAGSAQDTTRTYAGDVAAAVQFLKARTDIDPKQIGLLGHSEGGIIAPMVAVETHDVAFLVLVAGPGLPGRDIVLEQVRLIAKAEGTGDAQIEEAVALQSRVLDAALTNTGLDEVRAELRKQYQTTVDALTDSQRQAIGDVNQWVEQNVNIAIQSVTSPWYRASLAYDPAPTLAKVDVPVLALFGGRDTQVPAGPNQDAVMKALDEGGNKDHTAKLFPEANHLYQSAKTGSPSEYAQLKPEFVPGFLDTISEWILARVHVAGA